MTELFEEFDMDKRTCNTCDVDYAPRHSRQLYCTTACRPRSHVQVKKTCDWCGTECVKERRQSRYAGTFCSRKCRDFSIRNDGEGSCAIPSGHWSRWFGSSSTWQAPDSPRPMFVANRCEDCATCFIEANHGTPSAYCTQTCARRTMKRRRRAREHTAPGDFTLSQLIAQYMRQGRACAYCKQPCIGLPDPEHVLPLSRGGRNDMSNLVAACRQCNTSKSDLTLTEWSKDREQRGMPEVDTSLNGPEFAHLMHTAPTEPAWRHSQSNTASKVA